MSAKTIPCVPWPPPRIRSRPLRASLLRNLSCTILSTRAFHPAKLSLPQTHPRIAAQRWRPPFAPHHRPLTTRAAAFKLFHAHPFSISLATLIILFGMGTLVYTNYIYKHYIIDQFARYPETVAVKLRRAIYYHNVDVNPQLAVKYYRQGLEEAAKCGMDPFSDEIIGVKIQLAFLMEKIGQVRRAAEVLEVVMKDCDAWLDDPERGGKDERRAQRGRVLGKMVGVSVKLGDLYADPQIKDQEGAEERLVWAVTTVLKEKERRQREGVKEGEGEWMSEEEIGGALEGEFFTPLFLCPHRLQASINEQKKVMVEIVNMIPATALGNHYEARSQHFLAAPLYLQAISLIPTTNCHAITLMNNLSVSLALQNPPPTGGMPSPSAASQIDAAKTWANKALAVHRALQNREEKTDECDEACAVTQINLGEFAEMEGNLQEAKRAYEKGVEFSRGVGFQEGVIRGREALGKLDRRK